MLWTIWHHQFYYCLSPLSVLSLTQLLLLCVSVSIYSLFLCLCMHAVYAVYILAPPSLQLFLCPVESSQLNRDIWDNFPPFPPINFSSFSSLLHYTMKLDWHTTDHINWPTFAIKASKYFCQLILRN
jgi:hypothetical protein